MTLLVASDLTGMFPALVTPFTPDGSIDRPALVALTEHLIECGARGLVPVGGTGEYTAMSPVERVEVVKATIDAAAGRVPVIPGVLSPGYAEALATGRAFMDAGAAGLLLVAPFYVRPTPAGVRAYFAQYARESGAPLLLYDIPARTGVAVDPDTIGALADNGSIIGIKACNTDLGHFERTIMRVGNRIGILSGDDYLYPVHAALGAHGGILASSVLLPKRWQTIADLCSARRFDEALAAHRELAPLLDALFAQTNPGPLKAALRLSGRQVGSVRLPLQDPDAALMTLLQRELAPLSKEESRPPAAAGLATASAAMQAAVEPSASWEELQRRLAESKLELSARGGGLVLRTVDTKTVVCKASETGFGYSDLIRKFKQGFPGHPHQWLADRLGGE